MVSPSTFLATRAFWAPVGRKALAVVGEIVGSGGPVGSEEGDK